MRIRDIRLNGNCVNGKLNGDFSISIDATKNGSDHVITATWTGKSEAGYPVGVVEHVNGFKNDSPSKVYCIREEGCFLKENYAREKANKVNKNELAKYLDDRYASKSNACTDAIVPNPYPLPDETTEFYGECRESRAETGIVIWKQKNIAFNISCLENGKYLSLKELLNSGFRKGDSKSLGFVAALPKSCFKDGYRGQCNAAGKPDGVGFNYTTSSASMGVDNHRIYSGMFKDGMANGVGNTYTIGRCGMLGCTGDEVNEQAYFVTDAKQFDCKNGLSGCIAERERRSVAQAAENAQRQKAEKEFASLLNGGNPQAMYLAAGTFGRNGDSYKAKQVYEAIISRFPSSSWAVKANDQLNDTKRSNDAESAASQRQYDAQRASREADSRSKSQCSVRISQCENTCSGMKGDSWRRCNSGCQSLCSQF